MNYILYLPFALLPSIISLFFYLRKDSHPESNKMILTVFFYGMAAAVIAAVIEIIADKIATYSVINIRVHSNYFPIIIFILYHILVIGLVEELAKFFVVKQKVIKNKEFDEPLDAMLYMIIAALGFAALENLLYLYPVLVPNSGLILKDAALVAGFRFIGATFLHALASGVVGFFLAYSICFPKKKWLLLITGIIIASVLHGLFNISIIGLGAAAETKNSLLMFASAIFLTAILSFLAIFVSFGFNKLKKIKSICQTNFSKN
jgi:RsiW-degrading membrane proteinase PrsW (M82 family)